MSGTVAFVPRPHGPQPHQRGHPRGQVRERSLGCRRRGRRDRGSGPLRRRWWPPSGRRPQGLGSWPSAPTSTTRRWPPGSPTAPTGCCLGPSSSGIPPPPSPDQTAHERRLNSGLPVRNLWPLSRVEGPMVVAHPRPTVESAASAGSGGRRSRIHHLPGLRRRQRPGAGRVGSPPRRRPGHGRRAPEPRHRPRRPRRDPRPHVASARHRDPGHLARRRGRGVPAVADAARVDRGVHLTDAHPHSQRRRRASCSWTPTSRRS